MISIPETCGPAYAYSPVVYDKFHVIQNIVVACDQVRKAESRAHDGRRDRTDRKRWMWLKNRLNWTDKEGPKMGVACPGTVRDGQGLRDLVAASWRLRAEIRRGCQEAVPKLVRLDAGDGRGNRRTPHADGLSCPDGRGALGGNLGPLDSRADGLLHGGSQRLFPSREAQSPQVPDGGMHDRHALPCHCETHPSVLMTE